jgi:hypothetical protein
MASFDFWMITKRIIEAESERFGALKSDSTDTN